MTNKIIDTILASTDNILNFLTIKDIINISITPKANIDLYTKLSASIDTTNIPPDLLPEFPNDYLLRRFVGSVNEQALDFLYQHSGFTPYRIDVSDGSKTIISKLLNTVNTIMEYGANQPYIIIPLDLLAYIYHNFNLSYPMDSKFHSPSLYFMGKKYGIDFYVSEYATVSLIGDKLKNTMSIYNPYENILELETYDNNITIHSDIKFKSSPKASVTGKSIQIR